MTRSKLILCIVSILLSGSVTTQAQPGEMCTPHDVPGIDPNTGTVAGLGMSPGGLVTAVEVVVPVILLRPWNIPEGAQAIGAADAGGSTATTYTLKSAAFAFFSTGEDRVGNTALRVDDTNDPTERRFKNKDNIVEVGQ